MSDCIVHSVFDVAIIGDPCWSAGASAQHWPVRLLLRSAPHHSVIRKVVGPRPFRAHVPYGPANKPNARLHPDDFRHITDEEDRLQAMNGAFTAAAGDQFNHLMMLDDKAAYGHSGRAAGPKTSCTCAADIISDDRRSSTPLSRAWGLVRSWLHVLGGNGSQKNRAWARRKNIDTRIHTT